tara:strand:- start:111 stop:824 length:714 start_codon:yes stop_codon:yes gene_type:complete
MLSRNQIKFIKSLKQKKFRLQQQLFVVEGEKLVNEFLNSDWEIEQIYATKEWQGEGGAVEITTKELERISFLKTPNKVLAIVKIPLKESVASENLVLALDAVKDPGNLGAIIRLADWFGVQNILCSEDCVEMYNPKVVQASMGSIIRVQVQYVDLKSTLESMDDYQVYAAVIDGENMFSIKKSEKIIVLMGSESHGVSQDLLKLQHQKITIPKSGNSKIESLNVANACGIILAQLSR